MKRICILALTLAGLALVFLAVPAGAAGASPQNTQAVRYWKYFPNPQPVGANLEYSIDGGATWSPVPLGGYQEYSSSVHIKIRNTGTAAGTYNDTGSSTGDEGNKDRFLGVETIKPGTTIEQWPGTLVVIAGTIIGIIKGALGLIGSLFSCVGTGGNHNYCDIQRPTNPADYVTVQATRDGFFGTSKFELLNETGPYPVRCYSDLDPASRYLSTSVPCATYSLSGTYLYACSSSGGGGHPAVGPWGLGALALLLGGAGWLVLRGRAAAGS